MALSLLLAIPLSISFTTSLSFDPPPISCVMMPLVNNHHPRDGPVAITFEFDVDRLLTRSNIYRIEMMVPSWSGYLLQRRRLTKAEQETINKVWRLHVGEDIPDERYYLCVNRELNARGTTVTQPSSMPTPPIDLSSQEVQRMT